jgi:hypothetical protein
MPVWKRDNVREEHITIERITMEIVVDCSDGAGG